MLSIMPFVPCLKDSNVGTNESNNLIGLSVLFHPYNVPLTLSNLSFINTLSDDESYVNVYLFIYFIIIKLILTNYRR